ncbi:MAG: cohesin domain-containing protein, partial [Candidatus Marinimicrobia bacterium]|nr:cohesin domain-containing protein [Candidatus Neomarinimicrobiota bacterium]
MARINKIRLAGWVVLLFTALWLGGCSTSMQARSAFQEAEQLTDEESFDLAIEKYAEAIELEPGSKTYKLKMVAAKTRAAATHIRRARAFANEGKFAEAIGEYRIAKGFDRSVEVAAQEEKEILKLLDAKKLADKGAQFWGKGNTALARKAIEGALKLDPHNARALAIKDLLDRDQKKIAMDGIELDVASDEPITLSFKDANIKEVFGILSQLSGINFIYDEDIRSQSISVLLEKASFSQAMELIMQMNGLDKKVLNSKTIIIYPQTREKSKQYDDQIIQTFYLSHIDAKKAVNLLRTMLQLRKIYVHEERNAIIVRDKPEVIKLAEQILAAVDRSDSEVLFDVEVLAVRDTDNLNFGPRLSEYSTKVGFGAVTGPNGVIAIPDSIVTGSLSGLETFYTIPSATFDYAKTLSTSEILASPKIRVKNHEKAKVHIGKRDPVVTTSGSTSDSGFTTQNVQYVDSGIKLDIEPTIPLDGSVLTKIKLEVISAERLDSTDTTGESPIALTTTNAETTLVLLDGARTILGGLYENNNSNIKKTIPFLGDIPLIGSLFTNYSDNKERREIILSITPYIIKKVELPDADIATIWSGGEDNLKVGPNFGSFAQAVLSEVESTKPQVSPAVNPVQAERYAAWEGLKGTRPVVTEPPASSAEPVVAPPEETTVEVMPRQEIRPTEEVVMTEVLGSKEEIGVPIVLEMPKKAPAAISFYAPDQIDKGAEFTVAVQVKNIEKLYSAPLFVKYDPAVLELVNINEGDFLKQDGQTTVFSSSPNRTTGP